MSNTAKAANGAEYYEHKIYELADEYINRSPVFSDCEEDEIKSLMRKSQPFRGMLKYIFNNLFKIGKNDIKYNNKNSNIDYSDIDLLNNIWDIYISLCSKYLQNPTILNFEILTGIQRETITTWSSGDCRGGSDGASSAHSISAKKWLGECEAALMDSAMTGNPGAMFLLKANYGYTEAPQKIEVVGGQLPSQTAADIAARHQIGQMERPELPNFDE